MRVILLACLVCSANSTLQSLSIDDNPISDAARKAVELELVLCKMRNPKVTMIHASGKGFDDQDAIKIGEGLPYVLSRRKCPFFLATLRDFLFGFLGGDM